MRDEIKLLVQMQRLDRTLRELRAERAQFARDIEDVVRTAESQARRLVDRADEARTLRKAQDRKEVDLKEIEERLARLQVQLNMTRTPREYTALQHEIMGLKADASKIEDEILAMLEEADSRKAETKGLAGQAEEAKRTADSRRRSLETASQDAAARIERVAQERAELAQNVPPEYLSKYERLLKSGDGRAMAACRNFVCSACSMTLTANTVNLLMAGEQLTFCHSCGRILYLAEDEDLEGVAGAGRKDL